MVAFFILRGMYELNFHLFTSFQIQTGTIISYYTYFLEVGIRVESFENYIKKLQFFCKKLYILCVS